MSAETVVPISAAPSARDRAYRRGFQDGFDAAIARIAAQVDNPLVPELAQQVGRAVVRDLRRHLARVFEEERDV